MFGLEDGWLLASAPPGYCRGRRTIEGPFGTSPIPLLLWHRGWETVKGRGGEISAWLVGVLPGRPA